MNTFQLKKQESDLTTRADMRQARKRRKKGILHLSSCKKSLMLGESRATPDSQRCSEGESRTTNCFKGLQVEQGRAGTGDVHMQAGKVSAVQSCDQSRSEQLFPSFLARNWLLLCYLLFLASSAGDHLMPHILPSARVTF